MASAPSISLVRRACSPPFSGHADVHFLILIRIQPTGSSQHKVFKSGAALLKLSSLNRTSNSISMLGTKLVPPQLAVSVRVALLLAHRPTETLLPDSASRRGAFAQYAKMFDHVVWEIPEGIPSFEQVPATAFPCVSPFPFVSLASRPRF